MAGAPVDPEAREAGPPRAGGSDGSDVPTPASAGSTRHPLLRPIWLVAHVVVLSVLVGFPILGLWQWDRYHEERADTTRREERITADPVPLADVPELAVDARPSPERVQDLEYTPVEVTGTWAGAEQVAQRRPLDGTGGFDLLAPLELGDGTAVLVRRGWVPPDGPASADPSVDDPVGGEVTVTGWLEAPVSQPDGLGARDAATGVLTTLFHADVDRIDQQTDADLRPMLVHLTAQSPADGEFPVPQPAPPGDSSQNLSYTIQWFAFTIIVVGGYALVLRRRLRDHRRGIDSDVDPLLRARGAGSPPDGRP